MSVNQTKSEHLIIKLELIKNQLEHCVNKADLLNEIDNTMECLISARKDADFNSVRPKDELVTRLRYLRELRAAALDLSEEQVTDFSRDYFLMVSSMQFQLWQGDNQRLLSLIEQSNSQ